MGVLTGARHTSRRVERFIEDPLADFVLREEPESGSTVMVDPPADGGADDQIRLSVIAPKPAPTPVAVGAEGGGVDAEPDAAPEIPDSPPADDEPGDED